MIVIKTTALNGLHLARRVLDDVHDVLFHDSCQIIIVQRVLHVLPSNSIIFVCACPLHALVANSRASLWIPLRRRRVRHILGLGGHLTQICSLCSVHTAIWSTCGAVGDIPILILGIDRSNALVDDELLAIS